MVGSDAVDQRQLELFHRIMACMSMVQTKEWNKGQAVLTKDALGFFRNLEDLKSQEMTPLGSTTQDSEMEERANQNTPAGADTNATMTDDQNGQEVNGVPRPAALGDVASRRIACPLQGTLSSLETASGVVPVCLG